MKRVRIMLLILPTAELLHEPEATRQLLAKIDLPLETLAEALLGEWARVEGEWGNGYNPFDVSTYELVTTTMIGDYLHNTEFTKLNRDDQVAIITAVREFCRNFFDTVVTLLEEMNLTQFQIQTMRLHKWLGKSMVLDIQF